MTVNARTLLSIAALLLPLAAPAAAQESGEAPPAAAQPPAPTKNPNGMRKLFAIMKVEPSVKDVQQWAVTHYRLEPDRVNRMVRNARLKGLVPDVSVTVSNMVANSFSNTKDGLYPLLPGVPENPNPGNFKERNATANDEFTWSVTSRWQLDRLVFSSEALDAKSLTSLEENLIREVTTLYFSRRRVLASIVLSPPQEDEEYFYELVRLDELTATLNAFTGSKFEKTAWDWQKELLGN
jgi:hypothetical protein